MVLKVELHSLCLQFIGFVQQMQNGSKFNCVGNLENSVHNGSEMNGLSNGTTPESHSQNGTMNGEHRAHNGTVTNEHSTRRPNGVTSDEHKVHNGLVTDNIASFPRAYESQNGHNVDQPTPYANGNSESHKSLKSDDGMPNLGNVTTPILIRSVLF